MAGLLGLCHAGQFLRRCCSGAEGVAQLVAVLLGVCLLQASLDGFWGVFHLPFNLMDVTLYRASSLVPIAFDLPRFVAVAAVSLAWVAVYALLSCWC